MSVLDDVSKGIRDEMASYVNAFTFPLLETIEVGFDDEWDVVKDGDVTYQRSWLKDMQYRDGVFTATRVETVDVPNEVAVTELQALVDKWKERGWGGFVETVTTRDYSDEYESWTNNVFDDLTDEQTIETPIASQDVQFIKYVRKPMTFNPMGLNIPFTNARITGLTLPTDTCDSGE